MSQYPQNIAPISQYFTDLQNGTLPQVAQIEPATDAGLDEHPSDYDTAPNDIQQGAAYVQSLVNGLMQSLTGRTPLSSSPGMRTAAFTITFRRSRL